jgi:hypothetical protein
MDCERLCDDLARPHARVERSERVLKHHLHLPARGTQLGSVDRKQFLPCETDFARIRFDQPQ